MYILLEPGMMISICDEAYFEEEWASVGTCSGDIYREDHFPMRRHIEDVNELFKAYNLPNEEEE